LRKPIQPTKHYSEGNMSFFGSKKKKEPAPQPRPVPQKIAATTPSGIVATAAGEEVVDKKRRGTARRATKLTGARGLQEEAQTRGKTLLGA
jgi:hypothetical protein